MLDIISYSNLESLYYAKELKTIKGDTSDIKSIAD